MHNEVNLNNMAEDGNVVVMELNAFNCTSNFERKANHLELLSRNS